MPVLGIDTSAALGVAVVSAAGSELASEEIADTRQHAERLAPAIKSVLATAGLTASDLTGIAVGVGPGPFTGLRVGLVTARTLGYALDIPVWGVPSHDALAVQAAQRWVGMSGGRADTTGQQRDSRDLLIVTDARRKEVYWSLYRCPMLGPDEPTPASAASAPGDSSWPRQSEQTQLIRGPEVTKPADLAAELGFDVPTQFEQPSATVIAQLGQARARAGVDQPTTPLYLRRPDVHRSPVAAAPQFSEVQR